MKLANIPTHISNYSRASSLWAEGLETLMGETRGGASFIRPHPPPTAGSDLAMSVPWLKVYGFKRVSSEEIQPTISSPSINGNGRHHWSQSISVCCQQIERVWFPEFTCGCRIGFAHVSETAISQCTNSSIGASNDHWNITMVTSLSLQTGQRTRLETHWYCIDWFIIGKSQLLVNLEISSSN